MNEILFPFSKCSIPHSFPVTTALVEPGNNFVPLLPSFALSGPQKLLVCVAMEEEEEEEADFGKSFPSSSFSAISRASFPVSPFGKGPAWQARGIPPF